MSEAVIEITVEGGVVQDVSGIPLGVRVDVIDFDTDGTPEEGLTEIDGSKAVVHSYRNPDADDLLDVLKQAEGVVAWALDHGASDAIKPMHARIKRAIARHEEA